MDGKADGARTARRWTPIAIVAIMLTGSITAGIATAAEGTAIPAAGGTEDEVTPASASGGGGTGSGSSAGSGSKALKLKSEDASPSKSLLLRQAKGDVPLLDRRQQAAEPEDPGRRQGRPGSVAQTWKRSKVKPGSVHRIRWAGTGRHRRPAPAGTYVFRVRTRHGGRRQPPARQGRRPRVHDATPTSSRSARATSTATATARRGRRTSTRARTSWRRAASGSSRRGAAGSSTAATRRAAPATTW